MGRTSQHGGSQANRALGPDNTLDYKPNEIWGTIPLYMQAGRRRKGKKMLYL
jgi:hypothetical protein